VEHIFDDVIKMATTQKYIILEIKLKNKYFLHWNTFNMNL